MLVVFAEELLECVVSSVDLPLTVMFGSGVGGKGSSFRLERVLPKPV